MRSIGSMNGNGVVNGVECSSSSVVVLGEGGGMALERYRKSAEKRQCFKNRGSDIECHRKYRNYYVSDVSEGFLNR